MQINPTHGCIHHQPCAHAATIYLDILLPYIQLFEDWMVEYFETSHLRFRFLSHRCLVAAIKMF